MDNANLVGILQRDASLLDDHQLLYLDYIAHFAWQNDCEGPRIYFQPCSREFLAELHLLIKKEMLRRGYQHLIVDGLDDHSSSLERERRIIDIGFPRSAAGGEYLRLNEMGLDEESDA